MKRAFSLLAILLIPIGLSAQTPSANCPTLSIHCPTEVACGKPATIHVEVNGVTGAAPLTFIWSVSPVKITSGQNTPTITVDRTDFVGQTVLAKVEVGGLPEGCDKTESCSVTISDCFFRPPARRFDSYGSVNFEKEKSRLDYFGIQLQQEPGSEGYILFYGIRRMKQRLEQARRFLTDKFGINPRRITGMNAGQGKKPTVELWIAPPGASPPEPNPRF